MTVTVAIISHGSCCERNSTKQLTASRLQLIINLSFFSVFLFFLFFLPPFSFYRNHVNASTYARRKIESRLSSTPTFTLVRLHYCMFASNWHFITVRIFYFYLSLFPPRLVRSSKIELLEKLLKGNVCVIVHSFLSESINFFSVQNSDNSCKICVCNFSSFWNIWFFK